MRILLVSKFLHHVGGVETYVHWLAKTLVEDGHAVALLGMQPPPAEPLMAFPDHTPIYLTPTRSYEAGAPNRVVSALASVYSPASAKVLRSAILEFRPDIAHFHGTCYQLTPSVFHTANSARLPALITAHEYKLVCANQRLYDDKRGGVCTDCLGRSSLGKSAAILRRSCIKGARGASALGAVETPLAAALWRRTNGRILAPSRFARQIIAAEWGEDNVHVLELPWPQQIPATSTTPRDTVLYMGRVTEEKGILVALSAWALAAPQLPGTRLRVAGRGSAEAAARAMIAKQGIPRVDLLGYLDADEIHRELDRAIVTIHPAIWFENSPFSVRESLCAGVPAIVADVGGMPELIGPEVGRVVPSGDAAAWAAAIVSAVASPTASSGKLTAEVRKRRVGRTQHLDELTRHYASVLRRPVIGRGEA